MESIILYAPKYIGYDLIIRDEYERLGYKVYLINYNICRIIDAILSIIPIKIRRILYYLSIKSKLYKTPIEHCTHFILIKGEYFDVRHINYINLRNKNIKKIMYQWDSLRNFDYTQLIPLFNSKYTL